MDTQIITFNVKDKSAAEFFDKFLPEGMRRDKRDIDQSPYQFLKDEIILLKSDIFPADSLVIFNLTDFSRFSQKELRNVYEYKVEAYDDLCIKLVLQNLKIETN